MTIILWILIGIVAIYMLAFLFCITAVIWYRRRIKAQDRAMRRFFHSQT